MLLVARPALPLSAGAESVITETVHVPLHYRTIGSGGVKLGIYLSIGGGSTPQIFEFDTGGAGLFAAYAPRSRKEITRQKAGNWQKASSRLQILGLRTSAEICARLESQKHEGVEIILPRNQTSGIPYNAATVYARKGWLGMANWLGTDRTRKAKRRR